MTKIRLTIGLACIVMAVGLLAAVLVIRGQHHATVVSQIDPSVHIGGPFSLTDQNGRTVTEATLKGKWSAVYFGYTYCPDICPLTLQNLAVTQKKLGDKAKDLQIVFITVDPARDTQAALKAYLSSGGFPSGVIGLTGPQAQIDAVEAAYRAKPERYEKNGSYYFSHSSAVYLMDPSGQFNAPLSESMSPAQNAELIKQAMNGG